MPAVTGSNAPWINYVVVWGPAFAALIALTVDGRSPWRWYREDASRTKIRWWWLAVIALALVIAGVAFALSGLNSIPNPSGLASIFLAQVLLVALPEELGWRGYLTRVLLARRSPFAVSLIVGAVWGLWHGPKLMMLPSLFIVALALSVLLTAAYARLFGGTALAVLTHGAFNAAVLWFEPSLSADRAVIAFNLAAAVLAAMAILLVVADRRWFLQPPAQTP